MAAGTGLMVGANLGSAFSSISSSYAQAQALRARGQFESTMADGNARMAGVAATDAIARGETSARLNMTRARGVIGAQRASFAGQGVDVNSGSAKDVQSSTAAVGALDSMTIRNNAMREAMGYKVQASNWMTQAKMAQIGASSAATNTMITGGMGAISSLAKAGYWYGQGLSGTDTEEGMVARVPDYNDPYSRAVRGNPNVASLEGMP